ncbi:unnamed protein product [Ranitomeya imitator]|uniref:Uncharacterized protein n=1 Tax=Ranitomeya imitator TaxID=111125 RepID=A0ABN9M5C0_9NEOB|nr:unnamed protein product [Ranitomeya imitator]
MVVSLPDRQSRLLSLVKGWGAGVTLYAVSAGKGMGGTLYAKCPAGDDFPRIEFGVSEVIDVDAALIGNSDYSISSTLNPQAPEFILSLQPRTQKSPDDLLPRKQCNCDAVDGQYPDAALPTAVAMQTVTVHPRRESGKRRKKGPPGYYSYLEGVGDGPVETLVNGGMPPPQDPAVSAQTKPELGDETRGHRRPPRGLVTARSPPWTSA